MSSCLVQWKGKMHYIPKSGKGKPHKDLVRPGLAHGDIRPYSNMRIMARVLNHRRLLYLWDHRSHIEN